MSKRWIESRNQLESTHAAARDVLYNTVLRKTAARMQIDAYFIQPSAASLQKYHFHFTAAGAGRRAYEMGICKSQRATIQLAPLPAPVFGRASRLVKNLGTWLTFAASLQYLRSENYCRSSFVVTFSAARCYYIHYT